MVPPLTWRDAVVQTAAQLCRLGIRVFPCAPAAKTPMRGLPWKEAASSSVFDVPRLFSSDSNIAVVLGPSSGIMDIEPDDEEASLVIEALVRQTGVRTLAYKSSRGIHRLYRWCEALTVLGDSNPTIGKLECRLGLEDKGRYSLVPPSIHDKTGQFYEWLPGCSPWEVAPAVLPENIQRYFLDHYKPRSKAVVDVSREQDGYLPEVGSRHAYLLKVAKLLRVHQRMPSQLVIDMCRCVSQTTGSYDEPGRGEFELKNL
jgi:hypothetical protein